MSAKQVRTQKLQPPDENKNASGETVWFVESPRSLSTIAKFATYQATSFTEALRDEKLANAGSGGGTGSGLSTPVATTNRPPGAGEAGITGTYYHSAPYFIYTYFGSSSVSDLLQHTKTPSVCNTGPVVGHFRRNKAYKSRK
ncbi:unnamed protein product [Dibothriocephalus latus]|uniref:Uncharacterized protein n=1 Tax=Dibothriocephalus latus TaxID=60516 RepID=A0A3P7MG60_DIBLA|nr:unnamed protein product [Dibothriocephalus latus]